MSVDRAVCVQSNGIAKEVHKEAPETQGGVFLCIYVEIKESTSR